ncbi:UNVERIFIED_CONTAM: hypothetical protein FKN15_042686 [Acipenser sinensis]
MPGKDLSRYRFVLKVHNVDHLWNMVLRVILIQRIHDMTRSRYDVHQDNVMVLMGYCGVLT